ncbi:unnamed protein product [marine sediment metagenome]|uniref:Uncharacterized protein n=1 Tax=marine sediment metagenome TaxID=412755 RepID=X0RYQ4_9ZZZZ
MKLILILDTIHVTDKAVLFLSDKGKFWCPKSRIISETEGFITIKDNFDINFIDKRYKKRNFGGFKTFSGYMRSIGLVYVRGGEVK